MKYLLALLLLCGRASAFEFYATSNGNLRWSDDDIFNPLRYSIGANCPQSVRDAMRTATKAWSDATGGEIRFIEACDDPQISVVIGTVDDPRYAALETSTVKQWPWIVGAGILIGPKTSLVKDSITPILMHEVGHALGLMHADTHPEHIVGRYCPCDLPIMWSTATISLSLHLDDVIGIRTLYGIETDSIKRTVSGLRAIQHGHRIKVESSIESDSVIFTWGDGGQDGGSSGPYRHRYLLRGHYDCIAECRGRETDFSFQVGRLKRK